MPPCKRIRCSNITWLVLTAEAEALLAAEGARLTRPTEAGAVPVKRSAERTVWRLPNCHLKEYQPRGILERLGWWRWPNRVGAEWRAALNLHHRNIPAIEPLALGWERRGILVSRWFLLTKSLPDAMTLRDILRAGPPSGSRRRGIIEALATLARRLYREKIDHLDLHAGNVLITQEGRHLRAHLVDFKGVRPRRWWPSGRERQLGRLYAAFHSVTSPQDRLRFLRLYLGDHLDRERERALIRRITFWGRWYARRLWRRRDGRCLRAGKHFLAIRKGALRVLATADLDHPSHREWLLNPDSLLLSAAHPIKEEKGLVVVRIHLPSPLSPSSAEAGKQAVSRNTGGKAAYLKRISPRWYRCLGRRSPAMRAWFNGHCLRNRGLLAPRPLAVIERFRGPFLTTCYLITEEVEGALCLYDFLEKHHPGEVQGGEMARELGRLLRLMHLRGLVHRDLKLVNILTRLEGVKVNYWFLDLEGARRCWLWPSRRRRVRDLARLFLAVRRFERKHAGAVGQAACRAFISGYLGPFASAEQQRRWCRWVSRRARHLASERRRRRRHLPPPPT